MSSRVRACGVWSRPVAAPNARIGAVVNEDSGGRGRSLLGEEEDGRVDKKNKTTAEMDKRLPREMPEEMYVSR